MAYAFAGQAQMTLETAKAWEQFLNKTDNRGHSERSLIHGMLDAHYAACLSSARENVRRAKEDINTTAVRVILEVGCGNGINCFAFKEAFPGAKVIGLDPELEALVLAKFICRDAGLKVNFLQSFGEQIPLPGSSVDFIFCNTVIEHVFSVEEVVAEIARVLTPHGMLYLEAPNYVWPREPHLGIWCIPALGKRHIKAMARLQRSSALAHFVDHLQLVTPFILEASFKRNGLEFRNLFLEKMRKVANGHVEVIKSYRNLGKALRLFNRLGLGKTCGWLMEKLGLYPSLIYSVRRRSPAS